MLIFLVCTSKLFQLLPVNQLQSHFHFLSYLLCQHPTLSTRICSSQGSRETELLGPEESHDLLSINCRPENGSGVIQSEPKGLRTRGASEVNSTSRAEDEMRCLSSVKLEKEANTSFLHLLFHLDPQRIGWCPSTTGQGIPVSLPIQMLILSRNSLIDPRNNV